jgi:acetyl esterase/lipase
MLRTIGGIAALLAGVAGTAQAQIDPAVAFGTRPSIEQISLSPDGSKIAYISPRAGQAATLFTVDLATGKSSVAASVDGKPQRLDRCDWVSNNRLACRVYAVVMANEATPVTRMVALDADGQNVKVLSQMDNLAQRYATTYGGHIVDLLPGEDGVVLMGRNFIPEAELNTRLNNKAEGLGVVRIDTRTLRTRPEVQPDRNAVEYISDGRGEVRIMGIQPPASASGYSGQTIRYSYRKQGSSRWEPLATLDVLTDEGFNPYAIDPALNVVYGFEKANGRQALYRLALDGSGRKELVFAHPQVDVDGVIRVGRSRRPVGATYVTDKREAVYFDPELKALAASLSKSLKNLPLVRIVDASADEKKLLIYAGSDTDAGRYFVFDKASRQLNEIMLVRPELEKAKLATTSHVTYRAADGTAVPAYLTLPPGSSGKGLPAIVMPHGGPSARDEWGFDWLVQFYATRGYAVLQPNYRGSSGYGDSWFRNNGFQSWRIAIGDVNDAGRWLVKEGIADPAKLAIVGWSYGGYAALQSSALDGDLYKAIVAIAPVTDLQMLKEESRYWSNHVLANRFIGSGPHIREGSPTENASSIKAPVLMFHGTLDNNVGIAESRRMESKLRGLGKPVELVTYTGLDHYLEDSQARADMLRRSDAFLRRSLKL